MNDDLISRKAAIDGINNICPVDTEYDCTLLDRVDVRCVLSDLPSAQPERKKGKWIMQNPMVDTEECSECGYNILGEEFETPFCPWCGARMEGSDDEQSKI